LKGFKTPLSVLIYFWKFSPKKKKPGREPEVFYNKNPKHLKKNQTSIKGY
jgi:hypothetical protein